ncbi:programmed cell death protein 7 [Osmerus eperlanus]|uniref:programmed cell death protein 7 n=1 Tax=Osmerus eperlanus TaxID=29151 RepID=UPI002E0EF506
MQQPSSNTAGDTFGPGPYIPPLPIQPGGESTWDPLQRNMPIASSGTLWPPPYMPPPQQTPHKEWTPAAPGYGGQPYGYRPPMPMPPPRFDGYGPPSVSHGFGFDHTLPPPALPSHSGPCHFPPMMSDLQRPPHIGTSQSDPSTLGGPGRAWAGTNIRMTFDQQSTYPRTGSLDSQYVFHSNSRVDQPDHCFSENRTPLLKSPCGAPRGKELNFPGKTMTAQPLDEEAHQRMQDEQWLQRFLRNRVKQTIQTPEPKKSNLKVSVPHVRDAIYGAVELVSKLSMACETLKGNLENDSAWADSYTEALNVKKDLQERLKMLSDPEFMAGLKKKLSCISKRRTRRHRGKLVSLEDKQMREEQMAEKEAAIDKWRMKRIQEVEEKKREQELKLAADAVLSEVRKKQADVKRMLDILRSLEKLRKLRKEAASRKGIFPEQEADQVFDGQVERLRGLIKKRTAVYAAEENALRVMLEGEQEEERKRDLEKRQKKEQEKLVKKKREMEVMLFGDEMHVEHPLQPFREYYTQAERSVPALIQIRREWDMCLVPVDYPDGTAVPQTWVLPEPPSDEVWATALDRNSLPD